MQKQLEFIKKAILEQGRYWMSETVLEAQEQSIVALLEWVKTNQGMDICLSNMGKPGVLEGLTTCGTGVQLTIGGEYGTVATAKTQYKVMTPEQFEAESPWIPVRLQDTRDTLALYRGVHPAAEDLCTKLAKYREAAATLGQAQRDFQQALEAADADISEEIDIAVFEEAGISTRHVKCFIDD